MTPIILPATDEHAIAIAPRLRLDDSAEIRRTLKIPPLQIVRRCIKMSIYSWTWIIDERPACIFGISGDMIGSEVMPWLLTTPDVETHAKTFWRHSQTIVRLMLDASPRLTGFCDASYAATVRWLTRLGFTLDGPVTFGEFPQKFYRFTLEH